MTKTKDRFTLECEEFERELEEFERGLGEEKNEQINMKAKIDTPEYQITLTRLIEIYGREGLIPK